MEDDQEILTIEPGEWCPDVQALCERRFMSDRFDELRRIRARVLAGAAVLFKVTDATGVLRMVYTLAVEGRTGIVTMAAGEGDTDLTHHVLPDIKRRFRDCDRLRIHTARPGLARKLQREGFTCDEIVLSVPLC